MLAKGIILAAGTRTQTKFGVDYIDDGDAAAAGHGISVQVNNCSSSCVDNSHLVAQGCVGWSWDDHSCYIIVIIFTVVHTICAHTTASI